MQAAMKNRQGAMVIGVAAVATVVGLGGAYMLGRQSAISTAGASTATKPALPGAHPPIADGKADAKAAEPQREGRVEVDKNRQFVHFRVGNKNVKRIHVDGDVVWVGTSGGLIRYNNRTDEFKLFDTKSGLLSNGIFHVGALDDRIVLGTYGGGMALMSPKSEQWETYNIPEGLGDAFVYDVLKVANGDVWIATWSGANRVRKGELKNRANWDLYTVDNTKGGLPNDWVYGLAEGKDGIVWVATEGGLARFKDDKWTSWNHKNGLGAPYEAVKADIQYKSDPSQASQHHARQKEEMGLQNVNVAYNPNYIVSLAVDKDGIVWAGTWGGGLARFDGRKFRNYTVADGLPGNHVFMLHVDRKGRLWIGTNNGLALRQPDGKFKVLNTHDGLFSSAVFSMDTGDDGTLWVGSYGGVARIKDPQGAGR
jgi:ligand-binding sensor domain-containing protein